VPTDIKVTVFATVILPFVSYGCETWSVTVREEDGLTVFESGLLSVFESGLLSVFESGLLSVFESGLLREMFGPERDEVTEEWS